MSSLRRLMSTTAPASVILIRIVVGGVFLSEGIQKFLYPNDLGAGRFCLCLGLGFHVGTFDLGFRLRLALVSLPKRAARDQRSHSATDRQPSEHENLLRFQLGSCDSEANISPLSVSISSL